jgi:hypothetical protein
MLRGEFDDASLFYEKHSARQQDERVGMSLCDCRERRVQFVGARTSTS